VQQLSSSNVCQRRWRRPHHASERDGKRAPASSKRLLGGVLG